MTVDMSEFYQVFFEEAGELLGQMEQLLLSLDVDNADNEDLNAIFRCAHSIKGGAATFGFKDMTEVTHVLESLLDQIRKREKVLRREMVDTFLVAGDVIKAQLAGHRGDGEADPAAAAAVCEKLTGFVAEKDVPNAAPAPAAPQPAKSEPVAVSPAAGSAVQGAPVPAPAPGAAPSGNRFRVEFAVDGVPEDTTGLLKHVLGGLDRLGTVSFARGGRSGGDPVKEDGKPRQRFDCTLVTTSNEEDVWEVLAFNLDPASIAISTAEAPAPAAAPAPKANQAEGADNEEFGFFTTLYDSVVPPAAGQAASAVPAAGKAPAPAPAGATAPAEPAFARSPGRRDSDDPGISVAKTGRRDNDKIAVSPAAGGDASSIRVNTEKVDRLINLVGELVIAQAMLAQATSKVDPVTGEALLQTMTQLERNTRDLQEAVMSIRMMPVGFVFSRFPRLVRDLAAKLGKQIELKTFGEGTELDKGLIEKISDPLTHLVRNSLDHGIELPEARVAKGKPPGGTISLRAYHQGGAIVIEVGDDGAGLNREKILAKARERGLPVSDSMPDADVWMLIFEAGFSTADVVTDVSGRGVGMDVVKRNIQGLGGSIEIESVAGAGSRMKIRVPLTLAILDGMSVAVGGETFILPLTAIVESLKPKRDDVKSVQGTGEVVRVRGDYLPIVRLHDMFGVRSNAASLEEAIFVILEADGQKKAVLVDALLGQHQVVIKSLETNYRKTPGVSGATIMGDGRVALILDVAAVIRTQRPALRAAA